MGLLQSKPGPVAYTNSITQDFFNIRCFGHNDHGECGLNGLPFGHQHNIVGAASGAHHNLAVLSDGSLATWGGNSYGQLGNGNISNSNKLDNFPYPSAVRLPISSSSPTQSVAVIRVAASDSHSACVTDKGMLYTWGLGQDGQLGYVCETTAKIQGTNWRCQLTPRRVSGLANVESVALGHKFSLALTSEGEVYSFGDGKHYVLGTGSQRTTYEPVKLELKGITRICAGWSHSLALNTQGQAFTWGSPYIEINSRIPAVKVPTVVEVGSIVVIDIAAGDYHSAILGKDTNYFACMYTWGGNGYGQLGYDTSSQEDKNLVLTPQQVRLTEMHARSVYCGGCSTYVLTDDSRVVAWGSNKAGQLGDAFPPIVREPTTICDPRSERVYELSAGHSHVALLSKVLVVPRPYKEVAYELAEIGSSSKSLLDKIQIRIEETLTKPDHEPQ